MSWVWLRVRVRHRSSLAALAVAPLAAALLLMPPDGRAQTVVPGDPGARPVTGADAVTDAPGGGRAAAAGARDTESAEAAAASPVGLWRTIDDLSGQPRSLVRIVDRGDGTLVGRIEKILDPAVDQPDPVCERCEDDRRNQPIIGLEIIRGLKPQGGHWADGRILNPEDGKIYHLKATPVDAGTKLEMRGYIGLPMFGRTQTWIREP